MKQRLLTAALLVISLTTFSQSKLAYIYGREQYEQDQRKTYCPPIEINEGTIIISTSILMNIKPERYSITFGASHVAETPALAVKLIGERIQRFREKLKKLDIAKDDIYVDFISQNKVYDYTIEGNRAIEKEMGVEIKKNITVTFRDEALIEFMTEAAAEQGIYDVIKVEYFLDDHTPYYKQLFAEALKLIKDRKELYEATAGIEISKGQLNTDNLTVILPSSQYKKYTAYEKGDVEVTSYDNNLIKKDLRKSFTAYYEGISQNTFDKVINNYRQGIPIQMVLGISFKYYLKK